jgi:hypothetical protein
MEKIGNHTTDECYLVKGLVQQKQTKTSNSSDKSKSSVSLKDEVKANSKQSSKDLAAFIKKAIKAGVQQELSKKHKAANNDLNLNALEEQLAEINYNLGNLSLDEDDDSKDDATSISC